MKRAGQLKFQITIQQQTATQLYGEPTLSWSTFAICKASIEPISGREYFAAKQIISEQLFRFTIRYISGITAKMRISYNSTHYDIQDVIDIGNNHKEIQMICRLASGS